jgi:hypothetical protein
MPSPTSLSLLLLAAHSFSGVVARPAASIFARQDVCAAGGLETCGGNLPDNFCCESGYTCMALAGDTTALCCPSDSDCQRIMPIPCDTSLQDPEQNLSVPIKTTVFDVDLAGCGASGMCCPFGYTCGPAGRCFLNQDQSQPPSNGDGDNESTSSSSSAVSTSTSSSSSSSTSTSATETTSETTTESVTSTTVTTVTSSSSRASSTGASTVTPEADLASSLTTSSPTEAATGALVTEEADLSADEDREINTELIIAGILGGILGLLLISLIVVFVMRWRRKRQEPEEKISWGDEEDETPSNAYGNVISDPIVQGDNFRTDFIRASNDRDGEEPMTPAIIVDRSSQPTTAANNPFDAPTYQAYTPYEASGANRDSAMSDSLEPLPDRASIARLAPIRTMRASRAGNRRSSQIDPLEVSGGTPGESINVFADPSTVNDNNNVRYSRGTTFTDMMDHADLGDVHRGDRSYVPGATPRI